MILLEYALLSLVIGIPLGVAWRLVDIVREKRVARQVAEASAEKVK